MALTANNELDLWEFECWQTSPDISVIRAFQPLIIILTTAGIDAETESTALVTDTTLMMQWCIWHADLKSTFAVLDPELTVSLPANLMARTGLDAMVHAIEVYCVLGFNPLCDGMAVEGLRLVGHWLPVAVAEPLNFEASGAMLAESCLLGIAVLKGLGLVHANSHMNGAEYDTQHGLTNAIVLPAVLRHNALAITNKVSVMAQAISIRVPALSQLTSIFALWLINRASLKHWLSLWVHLY